METTIKLSELININQTLKYIIESTDIKIDSLLKFKLLGIMKSIEPIINNFEIIRNEKIREFGTEMDDGSIQIVKDDMVAIQKFSESLEDVINSEVKVSIEKIKASDIFNKGIKAEYLAQLFSIIKE